MLDNNLIGTGLIVADLINGSSYHFKYDENNKELYFVEKEQRISRLHISPNYELQGYSLNKKNKKVPFSSRLRDNLDGCYVIEYRIDPELYSKLEGERTISYSTFSADVYDLPRENAYDIKYHTRDYKHSKNKSRVILKAKLGFFN